MAPQASGVWLTNIILFSRMILECRIQQYINILYNKKGKLSEMF